MNVSFVRAFRFCVVNSKSKEWRQAIGTGTIVLKGQWEITERKNLQTS